MYDAFVTRGRLKWGMLAVDGIGEIPAFIRCVVAVSAGGNYRIVCVDGLAAQQKQE